MITYEQAYSGSASFVSKYPWQCGVLPVILCLNASCRSLTEGSAILDQEFFCANFPPPSKFVEGGVLGCTEWSPAMEEEGGTAHTKILMFVHAWV